MQEFRMRGCGMPVNGQCAHVVVERLPDQVARCYSRKRRRGAFGHGGSASRRRSQSKATTPLEASLPVPGDGRVKASSCRLPMALPMYSKVGGASSGAAGSDGRPGKRQGAENDGKTVGKIKIRRVSKPSTLSKEDASADPSKWAEKSDLDGEEVCDGSGGPADKYEIVSVEKRDATPGGRSTDRGDESYKAIVEAWLMNQACGPRRQKSAELPVAGEEDERHSVRRDSSYAESCLNQDTESYHSCGPNVETLESDLSQGTEIHDDPCGVGSETEIEDTRSCETGESASSGPGLTVPATGGNAGSPPRSESRDEVSRLCLDTVRSIVSHARPQPESARDSTESAPLTCPDGSEGQKSRRNASEVVRGDDAGCERSRTTAGEVCLVALVEDDRNDCKSISICEGAELLTRAGADESNTNVKKKDLEKVSQMPAVPNARTLQPPDSTTEDGPKGRAAGGRDPDCYIVPDAPRLSGACMAAAKELDLFANLTILGWGEASSLADEYLAHLERCLTLLDLMPPAPRGALVAALGTRAGVLRRIFARLRALLRHSPHLARALSVEAGFCGLLGAELPPHCPRPAATSGGPAAGSLWKQLSSSGAPGNGTVPPPLRSVCERVQCQGGAGATRAEQGPTEDGSGHPKHLASLVPLRPKVQAERCPPALPKQPEASLGDQCSRQYIVFDKMKQIANSSPSSVPSAVVLAVSGGSTVGAGRPSTSQTVSGLPEAISQSQNMLQKLRQSSGLVISALPAKDQIQKNAASFAKVPNPSGSHDTERPSTCPARGASEAPSFSGDCKRSSSSSVRPASTASSGVQSRVHVILKPVQQDTAQNACRRPNILSTSVLTCRSIEPKHHILPFPVASVDSRQQRGGAAPQLRAGQPTTRAPVPSSVVSCSVNSTVVASSATMHHTSSLRMPSIPVSGVVYSTAAIPDPRVNDPRANLSLQQAVQTSQGARPSLQSASSAQPAFQLLRAFQATPNFQARATLLPPGIILQRVLQPGPAQGQRPTVEQHARPDCYRLIAPMPCHDERPVLPKGSVASEACKASCEPRWTTVPPQVAAVALHPVPPQLLLPLGVPAQHTLGQVDPLAQLRGTR
ncbi:hypothetical protein HPB47_008889 [Ixodes persulcatus]|uniref:Uncharacterized protein n=1 Tax=Ixodes persulcatus TaxID=34615 RepID=A0AC60P3L6_IXOPE|nr:hypothetical protein HPB47_008889 [Ixodes persulcatus]